MCFRGLPFIPLLFGFAFAFLASSLSAEDLADVIERCEKSVVQIDVTSASGKSIGSGFVVESNGVLITNVHVLAGAQTATAKFADGRTAPIEGTYLYDQSRDICVAKIRGRNLPTLTLNGKLPRKGQTVTALGAPKGLDFTATNGIVSALRDGKQLAGELAGTWIQIDAALSPGNSGGPLIDSDGTVIAMSTLASRGDLQNLNFGISAKDIRRLLGKAREQKLVSLSNGIGRIESTEGVGGSAPNEMIERGPIPGRILEAYVNNCRENYADLAKEMTRRIRRLTKERTSIKRGQITFFEADDPDIKVAVDSWSGDRSFYFRNESVKNREMSKVEQRLTKLKRVRGELSKDVSNESLYELLKLTGIYVTPFKNRVGLLSGATVLHPFNDHEVIAEFEGKPLILWLPSTSGLIGGQELPATTVFVAGTKTVAIPQIKSMAVTVMYGVKDTELRAAIFKDEPVAEKGDTTSASPSRYSQVDGDFRKWTAGKHSVIAKVIMRKEDKVILQKSNGKEVEIARSILSSEDAEYLESIGQ